MTKKTISDIAVIGAGPVGMLCALAAVHQGFHIQWFNQDLPQQADDDRVLALSPRSMHIFKRLSIQAHLPVTPIECVRIYSAGKPVMQLQGSQFSQPALGYAVTLADCQQVLWEALQRQGVTLKSGYSIGDWQSSLQEKSDYLSVKMKPTQALEEWIESRILLMATGSSPPSSSTKTIPSERSTLPLLWSICAPHSRKTDEEIIKNDYALEGWMRNIHLPRLPSHEARECFIENGIVALIPGLTKKHGAIHKIIVLREYSHSNHENDHDPLQTDTWIDLLEQAIGNDAKDVAFLSQPQSFTPTLTFRKRAVQGRVAWLGNAAQTVSPVGGQGLNRGIADVWYCINALAEGGLTPSALQQFNARRRYETPSMVSATHLMSTAHRWPKPLLGLGLQVFRRVPPLRQWMAARLMYGTDALWAGLWS